MSANKRMLADWFSAALQTSRKCGRWYDYVYQVILKGTQQEILGSEFNFQSFPPRF